MTNVTDSETTDKRSPLRRLLSSPSFVALFAANALSFGGEQMRFAAQSWWILDEGGSKTEMGLAAGLRFIPVVIITLYAGVMIDRFGGKRMMILEMVILIFLAIITAAILLFDQVEIWHVVVLSTLAGSTIALGKPAQITMVAKVVPKDILQPANSMDTLGTALGQTLGPLLAGILIAAKSAALALFGLAVVYALSLIAVFGIRVKHTPVGKTGSAIIEILDGLRYIAKTPVLKWTLTTSSSVVFFGMVFPVLPVYAREVLEVDEIRFGWMWGALAVGQAIGALVIVMRGGFKRFSRGMLAGALIFSVGFIGFGLSESYYLSLVMLFIMGTAFPLWGSSQRTMLQTHSKPEYLGRVMAVFTISVQGLAVGWILGGVLMDAIGNFSTVLVAVFGGLVMVLTTTIFSKEFRNA
jgi:MFS family permease